MFFYLPTFVFVVRYCKILMPIYFLVSLDLQSLLLLGMFPKYALKTNQTVWVMSLKATWFGFNGLDDVGLLFNCSLCPQIPLSSFM